MISSLTKIYFGRRKGEQARDEMVKDVNCQILCDGVEVMRRWAAYLWAGTEYGRCQGGK